MRSAIRLEGGNVHAPAGPLFTTPAILPGRPVDARGRHFVKPPISEGLVLLVLTLVLAACGGPAKKPDAAQRVEVGTVELARGPVTHVVELPGRVTPFETSDVRPQVGGVIIARRFSEGANVTAGQVLYEIEPAPYRAALAQAQAQLVSAEASLATAKAKADRYAGLVKVNGVARQEYDDALAAQGEAQAMVAQQTAAVEAARINLAWTRIRAPISGRAGASNLTVGALVTRSMSPWPNRPWTCSGSSRPWRPEPCPAGRPRPRRCA
jgi:multidrug efflux pump subunit AcrA (membrane-fusion protein)